MSGGSRPADNLRPRNRRSNMRDSAAPPIPASIRVLRSHKRILNEQNIDPPPQKKQPPKKKSQPTRGKNMTKVVQAWKKYDENKKAHEASSSKTMVNPPFERPDEPLNMEFESENAEDSTIAEPISHHTEMIPAEVPVPEPAQVDENAENDQEQLEYSERLV